MFNKKTIKLKKKEVKLLLEALAFMSTSDIICSLSKADIKKYRKLLFKLSEKFKVDLSDTDRIALYENFKLWETKNYSYKLQNKLKIPMHK